MKRKKPKVDRSTETRAQWRKRRGSAAVPSNLDLRRWAKQGDSEPVPDPEDLDRDDRP